MIKILVTLSLFFVATFCATLIAGRRAGRFRTTKAIFLKIALGVSLVGVGLSCYEIYRFVDAYGEKQWGTTTGLVTASYVQQSRDASPMIEYSYTAAGMAHAGKSNYNHPGFGGENKRRLAARTVISSFSVGDSIPVFYDLLAPQNSKLKVGPTWDILARLGFAMTVLAAGGFGMGFFYRTAAAV